MQAAAGALRASPLWQLLWCACAGGLVQNVIERLIELQLQETRETHDQGISAHLHAVAVLGRQKPAHLHPSQDTHAALESE
jgi:hypothetical protein